MAVNVPDAGSPLVDSNGLITKDWYPVIRLLIDQANAAEANLEEIEGADPSIAFNAGSPTTTEGDLIVRGASVNERRGIGAVGSVLTSDGTTAEWSPAGAIVVDAIEAGALSAQATLDIDLSADYDIYEIDLINCVPVTDGQSLMLRFSQSSSFLAGASDYFWSYTGLGAGVSDEADNQIIVSGGGVGNQSNEGATITVRIFRPGAASVEKVATWFGFARSGTPVTFAANGGGALAANTNAIDGVRFLFASGNIATGYYAVRGYRFT